MFYYQSQISYWPHYSYRKKYDGELAEMSTKYFSSNLLQFTGMAIEIVSINM
ncbi:unnamed protein product [Linum tenue]|uniref:Uncharacterized protein n=1 Tax=Linum tenue TaxID=586396 RepID=A0AAV0QZP2_9ROSI|nr:unnamed protein product [Linum tenue]